MGEEKRGEMMVRGLEEILALCLKIGIYLFKSDGSYARFPSNRPGKDPYGYDFIWIKL